MMKIEGQTRIGILVLNRGVISIDFLDSFQLVREDNIVLEHIPSSSSPIEVDVFNHRIVNGDELFMFADTLSQEKYLYSIDFLIQNSNLITLIANTFQCVYKPRERFVRMPYRI